MSGGEFGNYFQDILEKIEDWSVEHDVEFYNFVPGNFFLLLPRIVDHVLGKSANVLGKFVQVCCCAAVLPSCRSCGVPEAWWCGPGCAGSCR